MTPPASPSGGRAPAAGDRILDGVSRFNRAVLWFKLVAWTVFAAVGPVTFFVMRNYVGVAVTSGISILIAVAVLGPSMSSHPVRPAFRAFLVVQGVIGAAVAAWVLAAPPAGWVHELDSSRPTLVPGRDGTVLGVEFSERASIHQRDERGRWSAEPFPGGLARHVAFSAWQGLLIVSEARTPALHLGTFGSRGAGPDGTTRWRTILAPGIDTQVVLTREGPMMVGGGRLERLHLPSGVSERVAGLGVVSLACASGDRVLAIQSEVSAVDRPGRAWESTDGGATFHPEASFDGAADHCAIADDGAAYAATSAMFGGRLVARPAGGRFVEIDPPLARVEVIRVNPVNGREVWIAGWGGGVFRSVDAGRTWEHLGLHGFEVESIHVDFASGLVLAATGSGIYARPFTRL